MPNQITPELLDLIVDIIGGLAGDSAHTIATMPSKFEHQQQESPPSSQQPPPQQSQGQPHIQGPSPSPYQGWHKYLTKKQGRKPATFHPPTRPHGATPPSVKPVEAPKVAPLSISESTQLPNHPSYSQPPQAARPPKIQPPADQHSILEMVKREAQNYDKPNQGTNLAHWLRTHYTNHSVTSQFEAAGVGSLDDLTQILSNNQRPQNTANLDVFHDDTSPFALISEPRQDFQSGGIPAVVVGPPYTGQVHQLEEAFPGVHFMAVDEAPRELEEAANLLAKPLPAKFFSVRPSPYSFRNKAQETPDKPPSENKPAPAPKPKQPEQMQSEQTQEPEEFQGVSRTDQPQPHELWKLQRSPGDHESSPQDIDNLGQNWDESVEEAFQQPPLESEQQGGNIGYSILQEREMLFEMESENYLQDYKRRFSSNLVNYKSQLPSEEELVGVPMIPMSTGTLHSSDIGSIEIQGKQFFYKGGMGEGSVAHEISISRVAQLLGVPAPLVRETRFKRNPQESYGFQTYEGHGITQALLMSWVEGAQLQDFVSGLTTRTPPRFVYPLLQKILNPGDMDLQILFPIYFAYEIGTSVSI